LHAATLGFEIEGRVIEIAADEGDAVPAGAVLARLDAGDQTARLANAKASAELAQTELELLLAGSRDEEVRRLRARLAVAEADAVFAEKEVVRGAELVGERIVTQSQYDALVARSDAAKAQHEAAREELAAAEAGTRSEDIAVQRARVKIAETTVALAQRELDKVVITAPFEGSVLRRDASLGDTLSRGQAVFELVHATARTIAVEIPSALAPAVAPGARARVTLDEVPGFELATQLDVVVGAADPASRNFRGIVRLDPDEDPELVLRPGMFVRVELALAALPDALVVPADAVRSVPAGLIVVRAQPGAQEPGSPLVAEWLHVRQLGRDADRIAVGPLAPASPSDNGVEFLRPGELVVVVGVDLAFPGVALQPRDAGP
jgi:HlyD family secretion protein